MKSLHCFTQSDFIEPVKRGVGGVGGVYWGDIPFHAFANYPIGYGQLSYGTVDFFPSFFFFAYHSM